MESCRRVLSPRPREGMAEDGEAVGSPTCDWCGVGEISCWLWWE